LSLPPVPRAVQLLLTRQQQYDAVMPNASEMRRQSVVLPYASDLPPSSSSPPLRSMTLHGAVLLYVLPPPARGQKARGAALKRSGEA